MDIFARNNIFDADMNDRMFPHYKFSILEPFANKIVAFTTLGSQGVHTDLNLRNENGPQNRVELSQTIGFDVARMVTPEQTHSCNVVAVSEEDAGRGALSVDSRIPDTDALITNCKNIPLMILTADCVPIVMYDTKNNAIAAIHAGWRGTIAKITIKTIELMAEKYRSEPENIYVGIGPCIGKHCFEVDSDVAEKFAEIPECVNWVANRNKFLIDLQMANKIFMNKIGVHSHNICTIEGCTHCNHDDFYSYRRNPGNSFRMGTGIVLSA